MTSLLSIALLIAALVLAPIVGGGLGELASGILQTLILLAIVCRLLSRGDGDRTFARAPGMWLLAVFVILTVISTIQSRAIYFSLVQLFFIIACLGTYILSATICRERKMAAAVAWALVLTGLFVSGTGVQHYILDAGGGAGFWKALRSPGEHARLFGPFINPNFFSGFLVLAIPITLGVYLATRKVLLATLPAIALAMEVMALMLTGAKFGAVAAAAALLVFLLLAFLTKSLDRARLMRLAVLLIVMAPILIIFSAPLTSRVREAKAGGTQVHSTAFRVYTWKATARMIKDQPVLGVGPGVYGITYPQYTIAGPTKFAHNSYLQIAAETGVPGLIAFLLLLATLGWNGLRGIARGTDDEVSVTPASGSLTWQDAVPSTWRLINCALFAALVGSCIRNLVDSDWYVMGIALPFWVSAGALVATSGVAEKGIALGKAPRLALAAACVAAAVLVSTFALGDYWGSRAKEAAASNNTQEALESYSLAAESSPLDPEYHRQFGLWLGLAQGEYGDAREEIDRSIDLARDTSEGGWKARGLLAAAVRDWPLAISSLRTALKFSPNSTDTTNSLALAYKAAGDIVHYEAALRRLIKIEKSAYEQIKGTPELVDTTYASAHAYFGRKYLRAGRYQDAVTEYTAAVDRLELWRSSGMMRDLQKMMGMSSSQEDASRLDLLRDCYRGLAEAYSATGKRNEADKALAAMRRVK